MTAPRCGSCGHRRQATRRTPRRRAAGVATDCVQTLGCARGRREGGGEDAAAGGELRAARQGRGRLRRAAGQARLGSRDAKLALRVPTVLTLNMDKTWTFDWLQGARPEPRRAEGLFTLPATPARDQPGLEPKLLLRARAGCRRKRSVQDHLHPPASYSIERYRPGWQDPRDAGATGGRHRRIRAADAEFVADWRVDRHARRGSGVGRKVVGRHQNGFVAAVWRFSLSRVNRGAAARRQTPWPLRPKALFLTPQPYKPFARIRWF